MTDIEGEVLCGLLFLDCNCLPVMMIVENVSLFNVGNNTEMPAH